MVSYFSNILNRSFSMYPVINIIFKQAGLLLVNQSQSFKTFLFISSQAFVLSEYLNSPCFPKDFERGPYVLSSAGQQLLSVRQRNKNNI